MAQHSASNTREMTDCTKPDCLNRCVSFTDQTFFQSLPFQIPETSCAWVRLIHGQMRYFLLTLFRIFLKCYDSYVLVLWKYCFLQALQDVLKTMLRNLRNRRGKEKGT